MKKKNLLSGNMKLGENPHVGNYYRLANILQIRQTCFPCSNHTCCFSNVCTCTEQDFHKMMPQSQQGNWIQPTPKHIGKNYRCPKLLLEDSQKFLKNSTVLHEVERHGGLIWMAWGKREGDCCEEVLSHSWRSEILVWKILTWEVSIYFFSWCHFNCKFSQDDPVCTVFLIGLPVFPGEQLLSGPVGKK